VFLPVVTPCGGGPPTEDDGDGTVTGADAGREGYAVSAPLRHMVLLDEDEMPTRWYKILHDLPTPPLPPLHPGTGQPVGPDDLSALTRLPAIPG
jgi:hypothetical protein